MPIIPTILHIFAIYYDKINGNKRENRNIVARKSKMGYEKCLKV